MALKFLNKKGWHTGSLRNIENVWKAEQKHDAENKKLEELKKQIKEEREAQEFRTLQEQAGLAPKQERLDFLYDSGLAVGKATTDEYLLGKPVEDVKDTELEKAAEGPGALFVSKPQSANDAWRKLHSDPLLLIRQQEQAALAAIKSNPVKMDMIRKEVLGRSMEKEKKRKHKHKRKELKKKKKKAKLRSDSEGSDSGEEHVVDKEHKSGKRRRRLKDDDSNTSSSGDDMIPSKSRRSPQKSPEKRHGISPGSNRDDRKLHDGSARRTDGSPERKMYDSRHGGLERRDGRSPDRDHDHRRWHNGARRRTGESSQRYDERQHHGARRTGESPERHRYDERLRGGYPRDGDKDPLPSGSSYDDRRLRDGHSRRRDGSPEWNHDPGRHGASEKGNGRNGRSPDQNPENRRYRDGDKGPLPSGSTYDDRRWRDGHSRRKDGSPERNHDAGRHGPVEKRTGRNGRSPDQNLENRRYREGARRRDESPERQHRDERHKGSSARNADRGSSAVEHVQATVSGERNSTVPQENRDRGETERPLKEAPAHRQPRAKLSEEEKAARLKEMQVDAELHEEQRWQRIKKGAEADAKDAEQSNFGRGKSFMDDTNKSVYGAQNGSNASLSESVRRRAHYRDGGALDGQSNAFRR